MTTTTDNTSPIGVTRHLRGIEESDLPAIGRILLRRRGLIAATTLVLTAIVAVVALNLTPKYSATTYIMIDPGQTKIVDAIEAVVVGAAADAATVESETRVLQSRDLAERVVAELQLDKLAEFNPSLRRPGPLDPYLAPVKDAVSSVVVVVRSWLSAPAGDDAQQLPERDGLAQLLQTRVVDGVLANLNVSVDGRSRIIGVSFISEDAAVAARVVNTFADLYIMAQLEAKFDAAKTANDWLNHRLVALRQQVEESEAAAERFRTDNGLIQNNEVMITTQEATDIGTQLALARSQRAEAEARLREVEGSLEQPGGTAAVSQVLSSGLIQQLRAQEAEVQRKVSDLAQMLGQSHPDLQGAQAELQQVQRKIGIEVAKIVAAIKNEVVAAQAREASLSASLESLKGAAGAQNETEVKLRALEREAAASRTLLETFLQRAQETDSQESFQQADARIVSRAHVPQLATLPKTKTIILAGMACALALAIALALLLEFMDRSVRSEEQLEEALNVVSFGLIPLLRRSWARSKLPSTYMVRNPTSAYAESIRNLYTGLRLSNGEHWPRVVMVASALPGEGKTTVAVSLACLMSAANLKTIIVDADLRRPSIHKLLGIAAGPGLIDYLRQSLPLESVIQHDQETGINTITAGGTALNQPDLLGADRMKELLARLSVSYDVVILDSAPLLAVSDARILTRMVDKTILLVRWADTDRETAQRALQHIVEAGGSLAGAMLTMVDLEKYAKYRYGAFSRYYRRIESYYGSEAQAMG